MVGAIGNSIDMMPTSGTQAMQQMRDKMFSDADSDGNGSIDKAEFTAQSMAMAEKTGVEVNIDELFSKLDQDGDGVISQSEFDSAPPPGPEHMKPPDTSEMMQKMLDKMFSDADSDGDGSISKAEFKTQSQAMSDKMGIEMDIDDMFSEIDQDGDGVISRSEFDAAQEAKQEKMHEMPPPPPFEMNSDSETDDSQISLIQYQIQSYVQDESHTTLAAVNYLA